ncbi:MAG TPA: CsgG/HfaB family protein [bacterium]|nr:CsgG/HfaB family protein [bacterium]
MSRVVSVAGALILTLALAVPFGDAQTPRKSIMVVDFADRAGGWQSTREAVTTRIISKLRDDQSLRVLPRDRVQEALQQAKVETAGMIDPEDVQKVAKSLTADFAIMGEVTSFDQQRAGGCLPIVGCTYTDTATVSIRGKVLDAATGQMVAEPKADVKKQTGSTSVWIGWGNVSLDNFDGQLIGKATLEAVDKFVGAVKPKLN